MREARLEEGRPPEEERTKAKKSSDAPARKKAAKAAKRAQGQRRASERSNKKAEAVAMMKRQGRDTRRDHGRHGLAEAHGARLRQHFGE